MKLSSYIIEESLQEIQDPLVEANTVTDTDLETFLVALSRM